MNYSVQQFVLDNFTSAQYYPGTACAKCGLSATETVEGILFCGRHLTGVRGAVKRHRDEMKKLEKWNDESKKWRIPF